MQLDQKDEKDDNKQQYDDFKLPDNAIPEILLGNNNIEYLDIINIMRECAIKFDEFVTDRNDKSITSIDSIIHAIRIQFP